MYFSTKYVYDDDDNIDIVDNISQDTDSPTAAFIDENLNTSVSRRKVEQIKPVSSVPSIKDLL
jgi:hypothetical protein